MKTVYKEKRRTLSACYGTNVVLLLGTYIMWGTLKETAASVPLQSDIQQYTDIPPRNSTPRI